MLNQEIKRIYKGDNQKSHGNCTSDLSYLLFICIAIECLSDKAMEKKCCWYKTLRLKLNN